MDRHYLAAIACVAGYFLRENYKLQELFSRIVFVCLFVVFFLGGRLCVFDEKVPKSDIWGEGCSQKSGATPQNISVSTFL